MTYEEQRFQNSLCGLLVVALIDGGARGIYRRGAADAFVLIVFVGGWLIGFLAATRRIIRYHDTGSWVGSLVHFLLTLRARSFGRQMGNLSIPPADACTGQIRCEEV